MVDNQTFNRFALVCLTALISSVWCACGETAPEPKAKVPRKKTAAERRKARIQREQRDLAHWRKRTAGILSDNTTPVAYKPSPTAIELIRVWRRHGVTGVIEVKQEHHGTREGAKLRMAQLTSQGWNHWSPTPAPELAVGLATTYPEFAECPFIMQISNSRYDWENTAVGKRLTCYRTIKAMEAALAREFVVSFEDDYMLPCENLGSVTLKENGPYFRSLRKRCRRLGFDVTPQQASPKERDLVKREKNNRLHKKRITSKGQ